MTLPSYCTKQWDLGPKLSYTIVLVTVLLLLSVLFTFDYANLYRFSVVTDDQDGLSNNVDKLDFEIVAQKLIGFPTVLWISIAESGSKRRQHMENLFHKTGITNIFHKGVICNDIDDCHEFADYDRKQFRLAGQVGCTIAHLEAIRYFYDNTDLPEIVIAEDDASFDAVPYWLHDWSYYFRHMPADFDVMQLIATHKSSVKRFETLYNRTILSHPIERVRQDWGTPMYMISRHGAAEMMAKYRLPNGKWNFKEIPVPVADILLYTLPNTFVWNLFTTTMWEEESQIEMNRKPALNMAMYQQLQAWQTDPI